MNTKNIFYTSSSHINLFPKNSRGDFKSLIDEQKFHHLNESNIQAAVKNVTFENKFSTFYSENLQPDLIIIQDYGLDFVHGRPLYKYEGKWGSGKIDITSGKDYYLFEDGFFGEGKNFTTRNFTDVKLLCKTINSPTLKFGYLEELTTITIHNIYLHDVVIESVKELISYMNNIYQNLEFDLQNNRKRDKSKLFRGYGKEHTIFYDKRQHGLDVLLSNNLCYILGYDKQDLKTYKFANLRHQVQAVLKEKKDTNDDEFVYKQPD